MLDIRLLTLLVIAFIVGCGESSGPSTAYTGENFVEPSKEEILEAINKVRSQNIDCNNGLGYVGPSQPLTWNNELYNSAHEHSEDMSQSGTFSHTGSGTEYDITGYNRGKKSDFTERILDNGYTNYTTVGENIAGGFFSLDEVMEQWKKSPEHCENLMREDFDEVGLAIVVNPNSKYGIYWTQNFGKQNKNK